MAKKTTKKAKKTAEVEALETTKVDLDELVSKAKTSIVATDYQSYLRNKFKGIK